MKQIVLLIALVLAVLGNFSILSAEDMIQITKVHQSFFKISDRQTFYIRDSILVQDSQTMLSHRGQLIEIQHFRRIVRLDENKIYELNLKDSTIATLDIDDFIKLNQKQYENDLESSKERAELEDKLSKSKKRTAGVKKIKQYGKWANRFEWQTDTLKYQESTSTDLGSGTKTHLLLKGAVLKNEEDSLYVERKTVYLPGNPSLQKLGNFMVKLTHFDSAEEWLVWYFTKYHFHGYAGFSEGVQHLVPVGGGFDTLVTELRISDIGFPINATYKIFLNDRERKGLVAKGNAISFADQTYVVKSLDEDNILLFDSINVDICAEESAPDSLYKVPNDFESQFFPKDNVYRFFETESRIVRKEHLGIVM